MTPCELPGPLLLLSCAVLPAVRQAYDINASRFDPLVGDDTSTFGFSVYRNSWYLIEQVLKPVDGWVTARPDGSLRMSGFGYLVHSYRHGWDEDADVNAFRLDDPAHSLTKQQIAQINGQLMLNLQMATDLASSSVDGLPQLVIIHAGNPDDGCCGVWIGAPIPSEQVVDSVWAWIRPLWLIDRPKTAADPSLDLRDVPRHDELAEPHVDVRPRDVDEEEESDDDTGGI